MGERILVEIGSITRFIGVVLLAAALVATGVGAALAQAWQPARAVEIIVGTSAGGGQDTSARFVQKLIQEHKLVAVPMAVVNKPGASSSIGYTYLSQQVGNGNHLMLLTVPLLTNYIMGVSTAMRLNNFPLSFRKKSSRTGSSLRLPALRQDSEVSLARLLVGGILKKGCSAC